MANDLSDGALAELLLLKCKIPLSEVLSFIAARDDVRAMDDVPVSSICPESVSETVPSRGGTVRIGQGYVSEAAE